MTRNAGKLIDLIEIEYIRFSMKIEIVVFSILFLGKQNPSVPNPGPTLLDVNSAGVWGKKKPAYIKSGIQLYRERLSEKSARDNLERYYGEF